MLTLLSEDTQSYILASITRRNFKMFLLFYNVSLFAIDLCTFTYGLVLAFFECAWRTIVPSARKSVEGEIVLITGAGHGIGREMAYLFASLGAKVVCWDVNQENNSRTVEEIKTDGKVAYGYLCDVSRREDVVRVADMVRREVGHVTILVNNAGILTCKTLLATDPQDIQKIIDVDLMAHFWTIREFLPFMQSMGRGHIVAMSSIAGKAGVANLVPYCTAKFGVTGLMEALSLELYNADKFRDIHLTTIHPIAVNTGMLQKPYNKYPWAIPLVLDYKDVARRIVDAVLRDQEVLFLPRRVELFYRLAHLMPRKGMYLLQDFLGIGAHVHSQ